MNIIFENNCTYTYDYYLQLKKKTMDRGAQNTGTAFLVIFLGLLALFLAKHWYMLALAPGIGILFLIYRLYRMPVLLAKFAARKNRETYGRDIETSNLFYEDHVLAVNLQSKNQTNIPYTEVLRIQESRDLYILSMQQGLALLIDKHGFVKGVAEDFPSFLREKCVNAEVKL